MRSPLVHFLLIGAALFGVGRTLDAPDNVSGLLHSGHWPHERDIVLAADDIDAIHARWLRETGNDPGDRELAALVRAAADEEILFRAAHALDLHRTDQVVWRRLVENMRFATGEIGESDESELFAQALALGMDRTDLVVRRRLVERVQQTLRRLGRGPEPTEAELGGYVARHESEFATPARVSFVHVTFARQQRGVRTLIDARTVLASLSTSENPPENARCLGDRTMLQGRFRLAAERDIAKVLGASFAREVMRLQPGTWAGPIASPFGHHLVRVDAHQATAVRSLDAARQRARLGVLQEREDEALRLAMARLRSLYDVRVESERGDGSPS